MLSCLCGLAHCQGATVDFVRTLKTSLRPCCEALEGVLKNAQRLVVPLTDPVTLTNPAKSQKKRIGTENWDEVKPSGPTIDPHRLLIMVITLQDLAKITGNRLDLPFLLLAN